MYMPWADILEALSQDYIRTASSSGGIGVAIALVVLAANFMGDSLRDRLDPALRRHT